MRDERTLRMMDNYARLFFEEGLSLAEIAKKYGLSSRTIYDRLDDVARNLGVSRDSLLRHPHSEHVMIGGKNYQPVEPINSTDLTERMDAAAKELDNIKLSLDKEIKKIEEQLAEIEEV